MRVRSGGRSAQVAKWRAVLETTHDQNTQVEGWEIGRAGCQETAAAAGGRSWEEQNFRNRKLQLGDGASQTGDEKQQTREAIESLEEDPKRGQGGVALHLYRSVPGKILILQRMKTSVNLPQHFQSYELFFLLLLDRRIQY